jgi:hypothetical protein
MVSWFKVIFQRDPEFRRDSCPDFSFEVHPGFIAALRLQKISLTGVWTHL